MKEIINNIRVTFTWFSVQLGINKHSNVNMYHVFFLYF